MGEASSGSRAEERVWRRFSPRAREELERGLSPTDLATLLMSVARARAGGTGPTRVLRRWSEDRFVRPSPHDPRRLAPLEATLWRLLPERFAGVELSPVVPLGTVSALGHSPVNQHRVVSTIRGTEVVSDSTNALAVEAAVRRRAQLRGPAASGGRVDLAACHRMLRAQVFGPGAAAHFRLFALVSSARDRGSGRTEAALLLDHLEYWRRALAVVAPEAGIHLTVTAFHDGVLRERLRDTVLPALTPSPGTVPVIEDGGRTKGAGYYCGVSIGVRGGLQGEVDLGDGGLTTYTAELLSDAKERCLVSCVSTERLSELSSKPV